MLHEGCAGAEDIAITAVAAGDGGGGYEAVPFRPGGGVEEGGEDELRWGGDGVRGTDGEGGEGLVAPVGSGEGGGDEGGGRGGFLGSG